MEKRILILDQERIERKLQRMAYEVWEHNSQEEELSFVGIEGAGLTLAKDLAARVQQVSGIRTSVSTLSINKRSPLAGDILLDVNLDGKSVVLVDDVANSGKTLLYALKPLLECETKKILIAVLVDRKHKSFPVSADIVGHTVATTLQEHIDVVCEHDKIAAAYLL